jgi:hypothetical protein
MAMQPPAGGQTPSTARGPGAANQPAGAAPPAAGPVNQYVPNVVGDRGWGYPRWPLLAAMLLVPFIIIGYLLEHFYRDCRLGMLCNMDVLPGPAQVALIWLAFGCLWFVALLFGVTRLEGAAPSSTGLARFLRRISDFETVRGLLVGYGGLALVGMLLAFALNRLTPAAFALGMIVVIVALLTGLWRPRTPVAQNQGAAGQMQQNPQQARSASSVLRSLFPFNYLFPNRAAPPANAPQPPQAGNQAAPPGP